MVNSAAAGAAGASSNAMSSEELRDLFTLRRHTRSDTYECMCAADDEDGDDDVSMSHDGSLRQPEILKAQVGRRCQALAFLVEVKGWA